MPKQKNRGKRDQMIGVWCSEEEFNFITKAATKEGLSKGNYCRQVVLGKRPQAVNNPSVPVTQSQAEELRLELKRIGNNLNQIARVANTTKEAPVEKKVNQARFELSSVMGELREALQNGKT